MMDNKFISHDTLWKHKAKENETSNQHETCLIKQCENMRQKRARENAEEQKAHITHDKEQKCVKLATETDEQCEKCLSYHHEWRKYLKDVQNITNQNLNLHQQKL